MKSKKGGKGLIYIICSVQSVLILNIHFQYGQYNNGVNLMRAAEKNRQKLSSSETRTANAKYDARRWKININTVEDYLDYMDEEKLNYVSDR